MSSEEPVDLLSLRVQVDVVETRSGGQAGDGRHLNAGIRKEQYELK